MVVEVGGLLPWPNTRGDFLELSFWSFRQQFTCQSQRKTNEGGRLDQYLHLEEKFSL